MAPPTVGLGTLRRLSALSGAGRPVLSVYLDLRPTYSRTSLGRERAVARERELGLLLEELTPHPNEADSRRVRELLKQSEMPYGAQGLAMFSCGQGSTSVAVALPEAVATMAVVETIPWLEPLASTFARGDWGVVVFEQYSARLLRGGPTALVEYAVVGDAATADGHLGNGSALRLRCTPADGGARRARRVAALLARAHSRRPFQRLVVVAQPELWSEAQGALDSDLRQRLAGFVEPDLDASFSTIATARTAARALQRFLGPGSTSHSVNQSTPPDPWWAPHAGRPKE